MAKSFKKARKFSLACAHIIFTTRLMLLPLSIITTIIPRIIFMRTTI